MKLREKLTQRLRELKAEGTSLSVSWDGGGDQLFMEFSKTSDQATLDYQDPLLEELMSYMMQRYSLPEVGEVSGTGKGEIYLTDTDEVFFCHDARAQYFDEESMDGFLEELKLQKGLKVSIGEPWKELMEQMGMDKLHIRLYVDKEEEKLDIMYIFAGQLSSGAPYADGSSPLEPQVKELLSKALSLYQIDPQKRYNLTLVLSGEEEGVKIEEIYGGLWVAYIDADQEITSLF